MRKKRRSVSQKALIMLTAMLITIGGTVGGSVAWLTDTTPDIVNSFTVGNISATFVSSTPSAQASPFSLKKEPETERRMVPGWTLPIDAPPVKVAMGSEDCYLFVKITEDLGSLPTNEEFPNFQSYLSYTVAEGWTAAVGENIPAGVYYRIVTRSETEDQQFDIIEGNTVKVSENITKATMDILTLPDAEMPTLTFTAYAVQLSGDGIAPFSVAEAWANIGTHTGNS